MAGRETPGLRGRSPVRPPSFEAGSPNSCRSLELVSGQGWATASFSTTLQEGAADDRSVCRYRRVQGPLGRRNEVGREGRCLSCREQPGRDAWAGEAPGEGATSRGRDGGHGRLRTAGLE